MKYVFGLLMIAVLGFGCDGPPCRPGPPYNHEIAMSLVETADGGIVFAGVSIHKGTSTRGNPLDCSLAPPYPELFYSKVNANGEWLWEQFVNLGPTAEVYEPVGAVGVRIADGDGLLIAGASISGGEDYSKNVLFNLKTNASGAVLSHAYIETFESDYLLLDKVIPRSGGGFAYAGVHFLYGTDEQTVLLLTDTVDSLALIATLSTGARLTITDMAENSNGDIAMTWKDYYSYSSDETGLIVIAADGTRTVDVSWSTSDFYAEAVTATDSGYAVAGRDGSSIGLRHIRADGSFVRTDRFIMEGLQEASQVIRASNGDFIIAGLDYGFSQRETNTLLLRASPAGELIWSVTNQNQHREKIRNLISTQDGGFVAGGSVDYQYGGDAYLLKVSGDGTILWERVIGI